MADTDKMYMPPIDRANPVRPKDISNYGKRADGSPKGTGFLGVLKRPDGQISSELSIGVLIDGKETEIPSIVPTLTDKEVNYMLMGNDPTTPIIQKAAEHARKRMASGLSPFYQEGE